MGEYVLVKDLPEIVQQALDGVNFHKKDISVNTSETVTLGGGGGGDGHRSFVVLIDLDAERVQTLHGSWGGANMFNRTNAVDLDDQAHALPQNGLAIVGSMGGGIPVMARIHIPASMAAKILTAGPVGEPLTKVELDALSIFVGYKAFARPEYLSRAGVTTAILDSLVERGFLKRNRAGATSITTQGKNAAGSNRYHGY